MSTHTVSDMNRTRPSHFSECNTEKLGGDEVTYHQRSHHSDHTGQTYLLITHSVGTCIYFKGSPNLKHLTVYLRLIPIEGATTTSLLVAILENFSVTEAH